MNARTLLLAIPAAALLAGCASTGGSGAATPSDSALASTAQQVAQPAASPTPTGPCTTKACIVADLDQGLVGAIDQGDAAATKVKCKASTVKNEGNGNYDARCTVHYSDHTTATGYGTVDMSQNKVLFSPDY
jgi:hypothetical protein